MFNDLWYSCQVLQWDGLFSSLNKYINHQNPRFFRPGVLTEHQVAARTYIYSLTFLYNFKDAAHPYITIFIYIYIGIYYLYTEYEGLGIPVDLCILLPCLWEKVISNGSPASVYESKIICLLH